MKEVFEHIPQNNDSSFVYRYFCLPQFNGSYRYHSELELTYIESSNGKRFAGSNISEYTAGDLVLINSNIPPCWKRYQPIEPDTNYARAKVLQFHNNLFDLNISNLPELFFLKNLFQQSTSALVVKGNTRDEIVNKMDFENANHSFRKSTNLTPFQY